MSGKPLLYLDVDGPLNPYACKAERRPEGYSTHRMRPGIWRDTRLKPLRVWLNPDHGIMLRNLGMEIIWATDWGTDANSWIGPQLGFPHLEVLEYPEVKRQPQKGDLNRKTRAIVKHAAGRPFAWLDDEMGEVDKTHAIANHHGEFCMVQVSPITGITEHHIEVLKCWLESLS